MVNTGVWSEIVTYYGDRGILCNERGVGINLTHNLWTSLCYQLFYSEKRAEPAWSLAGDPPRKTQGAAELCRWPG